jgi:hypothetical protein
MNHDLLAREQAAERGSLDPRPEPYEVISKPTRLVRIVEEDHEVWLDPWTGEKFEKDSTEA